VVCGGVGVLVYLLGVVGGVFVLFVWFGDVFVMVCGYFVL